MSGGRPTRSVDPGRAVLAWLSLEPDRAPAEEVEIPLPQGETPLPDDPAEAARRFRLGLFVYLFDRVQEDLAARSVPPDARLRAGRALVAEVLRRYAPLHYACSVQAEGIRRRRLAAPARDAYLRTLRDDVVPRLEARLRELRRRSTDGAPASRPPGPGPGEDGG